MDMIISTDKISNQSITYFLHSAFFIRKAYKVLLPYCLNYEDTKPGFCKELAHHHFSFHPSFQITYFYNIEVKIKNIYIQLNSKIHYLRHISVVNFI